MFVKVDGEPASLFEVPIGANGLEYGSHVTQKEPWLVNWSQVLDTSFGFLHYRGLKIHPHDPPVGPDGERFQPFWVVHWARWYPSQDEAALGVVTTSDLYVLNNNGKTIEALRHG